MITLGTAWAATKIREAGEAASTRFVTETETALADAKAQLRRATIAAWVCTAAAAAAAIGTAAALWL